MSENLSATIEVGLDGSKVQEGVAPITRTLENLGKSAKRAGRDAAEGLGSVGEETSKTTAKVDAATKNLISSVERATARVKAELDGGAKSGAKFYEVLANQRGVSLDSLNPYLAKLKEVEKAQEDARKSTGNLGISAAQTAQALRNVPAQFTDIVVSLQSGQKPLTVFLQQGGQLKDMFGGAGNAAKALGGYVVGLVNPFTIAAGAAAALGVAYMQGSKEAQEYAKAIILTGNAAGTTADQLAMMAAKINESGGGTKAASAEALAALVGTGKVSIANLEGFASTAIKMEKIIGKSIADTAKDFEDLGKTPVEASLKLNEQYNYLTASIYKQIKAFEDQGKAVDAVSLAQKAYADAMKERTAGIEQNLGTIESSWNSIKSSAKSAWDAMLGVGRDTTGAEKIAQLQANIQSRNNFISTERQGSLLIPKAQSENAADQAKLDILQAQVVNAEKLAAIKADTNKIEQAGIEFQKQGVQFLDKKAQMQIELTKATNLYLQSVSGDKSRSNEDKEKDKALTERLIAIKEKYKESISKEENAYQSLAKTISEKLALSEVELKTEKPLTESQRLRVKLMEAIASGHVKITQAQIAEQTNKINLIQSNELLTTTYKNLYAEIDKLKPEMLRNEASILKDIDQESKKAREQSKKWMQEQRDNYATVNSSLDDYASKMQETNELAQLEIDLLGRSSVERKTLVEQRKIELSLERELSKIRQLDLTDSGRQKLIDKASNQANIDKSTAELRAQQSEWTKFYEDIYSGLSDSLYRGFEAGKGFFQSFWDGIKNLFKTTVLKLAVQGVMTGVLGAGFAETAAAATGGASQVGSAASTYSMGKTLWDGFAAAGSVGGGIASVAGGYLGSLGSLLGSSSISAFGSGLSGTAVGTLAGAGPTIAGSATGLGSMVGVAGAGEGFGVLAAGAEAGSAAGAAGAGASISSVLAAIPGWGWAALAAAAVATKFGGGKDRVTGDQSVSGMLGTNDISRNVNWTKDGGWFNADTAGTWKYNLANSTAIADNGKSYQDAANVGNDSALLKSLNDTYASLKAASADYAKALGLDASTIAGRADAINFALGKTKEENDKAISAAFGTVADSIAASLSPSLASFAKAGESTGQTLARLASNFTDINKIVGTLGIKEFTKSLEGADSAQKLIELSGGIEKFTSGAAFFAENFLEESEKIKPAADLVAETLARMGKSSVDTIAEFRELVQGLDLTSESSAKMYAELIAIAPAFKAVADVNLAAELKKTEQAARDAADALKLKTDIDNEHKSLQAEYNQLTMTSAQLLKLQRDALFESNQGIFDSIQAVKAQQTAAIESAKDKEKEETRIAGIAAQRRGLDIQLMEALGNSEGALAATRADVLKTLDSSLWDTQNALWAALDSNAAIEKAKQSAANAKAESDRVLQQMQADAQKAQQDYEKRVSDARSKLQSAYQAESSVLEQVISKMGSFADAARKLQDSLRFGSSSPLNGSEKFDLAKSGLSSAIASARQGDPEALSKLQQFIELSKLSSKSFEDYTSDFNTVMNILDDSASTAETQESIAKSQLTTLKTQVDSLLSVDKNVMSVADAIRELQSLTSGGLSSVVDAITGQANAKAAAEAAKAIPNTASSKYGFAGGRSYGLDAVSTAYTAPSSGDAGKQYQQFYADANDWVKTIGAATGVGEVESFKAMAASVMMQSFDGGFGKDASIQAGKDWLRKQYLSTYGDLGRGIPAFAGGGTFGGGLRLVGENGPELEVTGPSRIFNASQTASMLRSGGASDQDLIAEIKLLREEVQGLRAEAQATAGHTSKTARLLDRAMPDGDAWQTRVVA
ncbi:phage tail length tape measure family protein [Undibacterium sp. Di24W]|uniref:phage tail length tape measure family protein n=1 Tax=Undibacterium sp. Di24W TaxID=3413033 RepID=UPI003BF2CAC3